MALRSLLQASAVTFALFLAGCSGDGDGDDDATGGPVPVVGKALPLILPDNITDSQSVLVSAAALPVLGCGSPVATCVAYDFNISSPYVGDKRKAHVEASMSWMLLLNDFDLFLLDADDNEILAADGLPPGSDASLVTDLEPGDYTLVVVGQLVAAGGYDLTVEFSQPEEKST